MEIGAPDKDPFALRNWQAFDSSPLIAAGADTLIQPGENGVIYTVKLNTAYDESAGTVTMNPGQPVKYRYNSPENEEREKNLGGRYGIENSAVAWRNYLIFTDNAGLLQCIDLNTMTLVYVSDMGNDSDVSMVLEEDPANNTFYLYTGCEYDDDVANKEPGQGTAYARKINGLTGEIIWEVPYTVDSSNEAVDGGILASPVLGKEGTSMAGLIIYNITAEVKGGSTTSRLVALDKNTHEEKWSYDMDITGWSPSSPVPVYTPDGKGYIVQCDRNGDVALIDGATGVSVSELPLKVTGADGKVTAQNNFEATPVVYNNMIVVGSRSRNIFFIKIS
jgi:outer membrane protein assembly factor BamB